MISMYLSKWVKKSKWELQISHILHPRIEWICEDELHAAFKGFKIYFISVQQNKSKKLSYVLLLFKHIVQQIWLRISIWTFSSTWSICFISLNVSMQNLQRNVFFFSRSTSRGGIIVNSPSDKCVFSILCAQFGGSGVQNILVTPVRFWVVQPDHYIAF